MTGLRATLFPLAIGQAFNDWRLFSMLTFMDTKASVHIILLYTAIFSTATAMLNKDLM
jgi:hypothetical protein